VRNQLPRGSNQALCGGYQMPTMRGTPAVVVSPVFQRMKGAGLLWPSKRLLWHTLNVVACSQRAISAFVPIVPDPRHSTAPFHMEPRHCRGTTWGNLICWRMPPSATERYTSPLMQSIGEG
jgi:hypothetical protein